MQGCVRVNESDSQPDDLRNVRKSELLKPVAPLLQRPCDRFAFTEHAACVLLIALEFSQQDVHFAFFHLVHVAEVDEQLVSLVEGNGHVAKVGHESTQLVENQVRVLGCFFVELLFLGLHHHLELPIQFPKSFLKRVGSSFNNYFRILLFLFCWLWCFFYRLAISSALPPLHPKHRFLHFEFERGLDALPPGSGVRPYPVVH